MKRIAYAVTGAICASPTIGLLARFITALVLDPVGFYHNRTSPLEPELHAAFLYGAIGGVFVGATVGLFYRGKVAVSEFGCNVCFACLASAFEAPVITIAIGYLGAVWHEFAEKGFTLDAVGFAIGGGLYIGLVVVVYFQVMGFLAYLCALPAGHAVGAIVQRVLLGANPRFD